MVAVVFLVLVLLLRVVLLSVGNMYYMVHHIHLRLKANSNTFRLRFMLHNCG